jgi:uncharacterized membrane protein YsdA (DUF1294 family)
MLITAAALILGLAALLSPLRNGFYALHVALVLAGAYYIQTYVMLPAPFTPYAIAATVGLHLVFITLITFSAYGFDKRAARNGAWRIPEKTLHSFELIGGTLGAFIAQKTFRHKTRKSSFQLIFWLVFLLQVSGLAFFALWIS